MFVIKILIEISRRKFTTNPVPVKKTSSFKKNIPFSPPSVRCPTAGRVSPWCPPCAPPSLLAPLIPAIPPRRPVFPWIALPSPNLLSSSRLRPPSPSRRKKSLKKSRRKIWSIRKKRVTLHSLFGTEVPRRPQKMETPPGVEKFEKNRRKIWPVQKFDVTLQSFSAASREATRDRTLKELQ